MKKQELATRTLDVPFRDGIVKMQPFTSRQYIAMRRGDLADVDLMEMTVGAVVQYLPGQDPLDLPPEDLLSLTAAWIEARKDAAVPPVTA